MRVVIDARLILPEMTGIGRYLLGLIQGLETTIRDETVEVWAHAGLPPNHPLRTIKFHNIHVQWLTMNHKSMHQLWGMPARLMQQGADVLHVPHFNIPLHYPGKLVVTIHNLLYFTHPQWLSGWSRLKGRVVQSMTQLAARKADRVIAVSHFIKSEVHSRAKIPLEKITVIHHGVERHQFQQFSRNSGTQLLEEYRLSPPFLLFVGERRPHKNIPTLIEAYRIFRELSQKNYSLVIAGKRYADYHEPEDYVRRLGLEQHVHFIDHQEGEALISLYHLADAFVLLSTYEGFGLPLIEAMAAGTPVVASHCTAIPEVVGEAGILVSPYEPEQAAHALLKVVPGGAMRQWLIARGKERVKQFTWEQCARQTLEIYRATCEMEQHA